MQTLLERRATARTSAPMFKATVPGTPALALIRSKRAMLDKYWQDAGLVLWVETAQVGDTFRGWERIA